MCIDSIYSVQPWHLMIVSVPACAHGPIQPYQPCLHATTAFSIFSLCFPYLVHFSPARRSTMNQLICHPPLPPLSLSFRPLVYLVVLSHSIISHVNRSLHLLSFYFQCSLISKINFLFLRVGLSATAPQSDMSDHKFKSQESKWRNL